MWIFCNLLHDIDEDYSEFGCGAEDAEQLYKYYNYVYLDECAQISPKIEDHKSYLQGNYNETICGAIFKELMDEELYYLSDEILKLIGD